MKYLIFLLLFCSCSRSMLVQTSYGTYSDYDCEHPIYIYEGGYTRNINEVYDYADGKYKTIKIEL